MTKRARIRYIPEEQLWQVTFSDGNAYTYHSLELAHSVATDWEKRNEE